VQLSEPEAVPSPPPQPASRREQGRAFVRRMYRPRMIGLALGGVAICGVLIYSGAGLAMWGALSPARSSGRTSPCGSGAAAPTPYRTELASLMVDSALGGAWIALMQFNLLPSVVILIMLTMDKMAIGGARFLARCTAVLVLACAASAALNGFQAAPLHQHGADHRLAAAARAAIRWSSAGPPTAWRGGCASRTRSSPR
jgi:diguanylate cyclase